MIVESWLVMYETIIRIGKYVRKSLAMCATQLADSVLIKKLKYFEVMLKIVDFSWMWEIVESWLVYANKFSWIA